MEIIIQKEREEQDKRRVQKMQKQKAEYQAKRQQLINAKVEKEKAKQEEIQDQMRKLQKERVHMQKLHEEYIQWRDMRGREKSEKRRKKNQERIKKREEKKEALKLGEDERTIPPKYRDQERTSSKKISTPSKYTIEQEEEGVRKFFKSHVEDSKKKRKPESNVEIDQEQMQNGPHWDIDPHKLSGEIYRKYIKKDIIGTPTRKSRHGQPDLYYHDCRKEHWGPCECAICGVPGHDENDCPELENQDVEDPEIPLGYIKRHKPRRNRTEVTREDEIIKTPRKPSSVFCTFCEQEGHNERKCPVREEMLAEKQKEIDIPLSSTMDREIEERVEQLRKIDKELDKKNRTLQDIEERRPVKESKLEPRDNINTGYTKKPVGGKTSTPA